jgi:DNA repair protein RecN (Recombination protein N)
MLAELTVQNLIIVERAHLRPGEGLVVISGETGAGKSLLLDAIDIVSGARVRTGLVGRWADAATVSAVFQVSEERAERIAGLTQVPINDGQVILRRRIAENGRSQAWINDLPVTVGTLRTAADQLIDLHAQHEPIRLADPGVQLELIDSFAGHEALLSAYRTAHASAVRLGRELTDIDGGERESLKEQDYLSFQAAAFEQLAPKRGEFAELERRHALLSAAGTWRDQAEHAAQILSERDDALVTVVGRLVRRLEGAPDPRLQATHQSLVLALEHLRDAAAHTGQAAEGISADPAELARVEERLDAWNDILRKHGPSEEAMFAAWDAIAQRLVELAGVGERRMQLAAQLQAATAERSTLGTRLAQSRREAFVRLAKTVHALLGELGMPRATIQLSEPHGHEEAGEPTVHGTVRQELRVCTNPGQKPGSIRDIASGGEASRLMLALSAALATTDRIPLMVFDEVDSGVGGRLGSIIGAKLARLGQDRTVLVVTHTPQVAACGLRQYAVRKHQGQDQTVVEVLEIAAAEREAEIADMLGGGAAALAQARELLKAAASVADVAVALPKSLSGPAKKSAKVTFKDRR